MWLGTICDLIAHAWCQHKRSAVGKLGVEFSLQAQENVTLDTPMVGNIAGRVFHHAYPYFAKLPRAPVSNTRLAFMLSRFDYRPVRRPEWNF